MTFSQGSHIRYLRHNHNRSKTSNEVAMKTNLWLGSPQHEELKKAENHRARGSCLGQECERVWGWKE